MYFPIIFVITAFAWRGAIGLELDLVIKYDTAPKLKSWVPNLEVAVKNFYSTAADYLVYDGYTPPDHIEITLNGNCEGSIISGDEKYTVCARELQSKKGGPTKDDTNTICQTTTWSIMKYPVDPVAPDWLTQCTAAYMRWYHFEESDRPSKPSASDKSPKTSGANKCAFWLNWVQENYEQSPRSVVQQIFKITREKNYKDNVWKTITGKTIKELWTQMQASS